MIAEKRTNAELLKEIEEKKKKSTKLLNFKFLLELSQNWFVKYIDMHTSAESTLY